MTVSEGLNFGVSFSLPRLNGRYIFKQYVVQLIEIDDSGEMWRLAKTVSVIIQVWYGNIAIDPLRNLKIVLD